MDKRAHIIASGRVQKAGFRIFVDRVAFELDLKGVVRNLEDGTVEIIVEGPEEKLDEFTSLINVHKYPIRVDGLQKRISCATGEFKDFDIIKDGRSGSDLEGKVDLGTVFLQDISDKQDETTKAWQAIHFDMTRSFDNLGTKQEETTKAVRSMHSDMNGSFGHLNKKYGEFGKTMKSVHKDTKAMAANMKGLNTGIKSMASDIKVIRKEATRGRKKAATG